MNVGDVVTATITVATDTDDYTTASGGISGTIGGFALGTLAKTNNTTYTATFTVSEGGADVAAGSTIPVNFTLDDSSGNTSAAFTTAINQADDAIDANSPAISAVSIPNVAMNVGDTVTATITVADDGGDTYSLGSSTVGGFSLSGLSRGSSTSYTAQFTVTEGGTDVAAGSNVPVSVILNDTAGNSNAAFTTAISQASDAIDANSPSISAVSIPDSTAKVNDTVTATITVTDDGGDTYSLGSSTVGGFSLSGLSRVNSTSYTAQFTVTEGGTDVAAGSNVPVSVILNDTAGNSNAAFTTAISQASDTIDANSPSVTLVSIPDAAMKVGDSVTATITVADDGGDTYSLGSSTVGGFSLSSLSRVSSTSYTASFTVSNGGADVAAGSDIPVSVVLNDTAGNSNSAFTTAISQASDPIDANGPTITAISIPNVAMNVGDTVTATITVSSDTDDYTGGSGGISGTINGFTLSSLARTNDTTYTAQFTVSNGGTDVASGSDIAVNVALTDSAGSTGIAFTTAISQTSDPIDANNPVISAISIPNSAMNVGDTVTATLTVTSDTDDYTGGSGGISGTIGGFSLGSFSRTNNSTYTAQFTVSNGGTDVAAGSDIPVSVTINDSSGNASSSFTTAISQASDAIDANNPVISAISVPDAAIKVGDTVTATITVPSDTDDYTGGSGGISGTIAGFTLGSFSKTNNTTYTATFTVSNGGTDVASGSDIPVNVTVTDSAANVSSSFSNAISQASDPVYANLPSVALTADTNTIAEAGGVSTLTATISGSLNNQWPSNITVGLGFTGTATDTTDYLASTSSITINTGGSTGTATVTGVADSLYDATSNETVVVDVTSVSEGSESGTQQQTITITDAQSQPTVSLSSNNSTIAENGGTATLTATLSTATFENITVAVSYSGTATPAASGADYNNSASNSITVNAGSTTGDAATVITSVDDASNEGNETIVVDIDSVSSGSATENGTQTVTITIQDDENNAPVFSNLGGTAPGFTENGSAVTMDTDVTISDSEQDAANSGQGNYTSASLTITRNGGANADDTFAVVSGSQMAVSGTDITNVSGDKFASFGSSAGTLTVSFSGDLTLPTTALVNEVLQNITYSNSSEAPDSNPTFNWSFNDSVSPSTGTNQSSIAVTLVNDAPALNATQSPILTAIDEDAGNDDDSGADGDDDATNNSNNPGTDVATIIVDGSITDDDGSAVEAIAVVTVDNTNGLWQYSTDNGTNWVNFSGTTAQSVSIATSARLLDGTLTGASTHKIRFVPSQNYNGSATFTFRAWDKTSGTAGSTADASTNGDTTAFSSTTDTAAITVNAINDTPVLGTNTGVTVERGSNLVIGSSALATTDNEDSADSVTYTVTAVPTRGALQKSDGTTFSSLSDSDTFTQEDINNSRLRYVHAGAVNTTDSFGFSVADSNSASVTGQSVSITIQDTTAPTITSVSISNSAHKVGDTVAVTILVASDSDNYTSGSGTINGTIAGYALGGLSRVSDTQYSATFTISDNGTDVAAGSDVPVSIVLRDSSGNGNTAFTTAISQSGDAIYANLPTVTLSTNNTTIAEDAGVATVTATLSGSLNNTWPEDVGLQLGFGGTATNTTDYTRSSSSLTISTGSTSNAITITSVADAIYDALSNETVTVSIDCIIASSAVAAASNQQTITITDAQSAPAVTLAVDNATINENGGTTTPSVTLSNATFEAVTINLGYTGTATAASSGADYNNTASTSITVSQGDTSANAATVITSVDDSDSEGPETIIIDVTGVSGGGATEATEQQQTVNITDDDNTAPVMTDLVSSLTINEDTLTNLGLSDTTFTDDQNDSLTVTLAVNSGTLSSPLGSSGDVTVSGADSASMTLTGLPANLNTFLDNANAVAITPAENSTSAITLTVTPNDGTVDGTVGNTTINITPINDAPSLNTSGSGGDLRLWRTSANTGGNLGGRTGADSFCDGDANKPTVASSQTRAFISVSDSDEIRDMATLYSIPTSSAIFRLDGTTQIAPDFAALLDAGSTALTNSVNGVGGIAGAAFTGTNGDGSLNTNNCSGWTTASTGNGMSGLGNSTNGGYLETGVTGCGNTTVIGLFCLTYAEGQVTIALSMDEDASAQSIFSSAQISDVDSPSATFTLTLTLSDTTAGTLGGTASGSAQLSVNDGTLTLSGTLTDVNASLASITYTPAENYNGSDATLSVTVTDGTSTSSAINGSITVTAVNDAPTVDTNAGVTVNEGGTAVLTATQLNASDVDDSGTGLTFTVTTATTNGTLFLDADDDDTADSGETLSASSTFTQADLSAGNVQYTHNGDETTSDSFVFSLADGGEDSVSELTGQTFNISVTSVNEVPVITSTEVTAATEDSAYSYTLTATDVDTGDSLTLAAPTLPSWLIFTASTGVLSGTPVNDDVGSHNVVLTATDTGNLAVTQSFTITVANTNDAPVITSSAVTTVAEDSAYSYTLNASDVDAGDTLTLAAPTLPSWLSFNSATGVLSGTPTNDEVGIHNVVLSASDTSSATDTQSFTITVTNTNDAPVFVSTAATSAVEDSDYSYTVSATDADVGDSITYSAALTPEWLSFNTVTRVLSGIPRNTNVGSHAVSLVATDSNDVSTEQNFTITVSNTNDAPEITSSPVTSATSGEAYSYTINANDVDEGDTLTYTSSTLPGWLSLQGATLSGTPGNDDTGSESVTLTVTDSGNASDSQSFTITIASGNSAPVIDQGASTSVNMSEDGSPDAFALTLSATDDNGDDLTWSVSDASLGSVSVNSSGVVSYTPDADVSGTDGFSVTVSDGSLTDDIAVTVNIAAVNDAPVISGTPTTSVSIGTAYNFEPTATDVDSDNLTFSINSTPSWASFNSANGALTGTPTGNDVGESDPIVISVSDGDESVSLDAFTIEVVDPDVNVAPTVADVAATTDEDIAAEITLLGVDANDDTLTYSVVSAPANGEVTVSGNVATYTPTADFNGEDSFTYIANDGVLDSEDAATVTITLTPVNDAPTISGEPASQVAFGSEYTFEPDASDVDGDTLTFSADNLPGWLTLNSETGAISGTPSEDDLGTFENIVITVSDDELSSSLAAFIIEVVDPDANNAPVSQDSEVSTDEDTQLTITLSATDEDGDQLTYTIEQQPASGSLALDENQEEGNVYIYTPNENVGDVQDSLTFFANDGVEDSNVATVSISIVAVNDAPVITGEPATTVRVGQTYSFTPQFSDIDSDSLTLSVSNLPRWATFDEADGTLSGSPGESDVTTYSDVTIVVSDGELSAELVFNITVQENVPPEISGANQQQVQVGESYSFTPTVVNSDDDTLSFTIDNPPVWASFQFDTTSGIMTGQPTADDIGVTTGISITVSDGISNATLNLSDITVCEVCDPEAPVIGGNPVTDIIEGESYSFTPTASDANNDIVAFDIVNQPAWADFDTTSGVLSGVAVAGTYSDIQISVVDSTDLSATLDAFTIVVTAINNPPVVTGTPPSQVDQNAAYSFIPSSISDPEGETVEFTLRNGPSWLLVNRFSGSLSGTPGASDVGATNGIELVASDGVNETVVGPFSITVNAFNTAPEFTNSAPRSSLSAGSAYSFTFAATDVDTSDVLTFGVSGQPDWLSMDSASGTLAGTAPDDFSGDTGEIQVTVSDGTNIVNYPAFTISVNAVNSAPVASNVERSGVEDSVILVAASVIDPDNDILTITTVSQPANGTLVELVGGWQYTPNSNFNGADTFTYEASDGSATSEVATVTMNVSSVNDDPVAGNDTLSDVQNADGSYVLDVLANDTDIDGDTLGISLITANLNNVTMGVNGSGQILLTAPAQFTGNISFNYSISDGSDGSDSANVTFVIEPNDTATQPPVIAGIDDINVDADALQTVVNLGAVTATDASGNDVAVEISGSTATDINQRIFRPGNNTVTWNATDDFGNQTTAVQNVNVRPLVNFSEDESVEEGTEVSVVLTLNGDAVAYPYTVSYSVSGTADSQDHTLADGTVVFTDESVTARTQQTLAFSVLQDDVSESDESIVLTLASTDNPGESADITITISALNQPPRIVATTGYSVTGNLGSNPGAGFGFFNNFNQVNVESGDALGYSLGAAGLVFLTTDATNTQTTVVINTLEVETFSWDVTWQRSPFPFFNPTFTATLTGSPSSYDFDALSSSIYFNTMPNGILNNLSNFGRFTANNFVGSLVFVPYAEIQRAFFGSFAPRSARSLVARVGRNEIDLITADGFTVDSDALQPLTNTSNVRLTLDAADQTELATDTDSDGDQIPDSEEGFQDTDNDGIPDYLDAVNECNVLPHNVENQALFVAESDADVCLQLGDIVRANQIVGIRIDDATPTLTLEDADITNVGGSYDFIMTDLPEVGVSPNIVIGQVSPIPANAVFRIYREQSGEWRDFSVNDSNDLFSAAGAEGICPPPGSALFTPGLTEGDWCVLLRIQDGGANDNDRNEDGTIFMTGGVGVALDNNLLPVAEDDTIEVAFNSTAIIDVLANDSDPDADELTVTRATGNFGSVIINPDSTLLYEPNNGYVGTDVVSYILSDGQGGTASANVNVTITANRAPGLLPDSVNIADTQSIEIDVLANDVDVDGDALTITEANAEVGTVSVTDNNTLFYVPVIGFTGIDIVTYSVQDTAENTSSTTVSVMVDGNLAPLAENETVTTTFGTAITIDVLSNDSDPDGDTLTITTANVDRGEVSIQEGSLLFIPLDGFSGNATITYTISDGLLTADGTVTVTVLAEPNPTQTVTVNNNSSGGGGAINSLWLLVALMIAWRRRQLAAAILKLRR